MPAWLRGPGPDATGDLLGIKWVAGFPANRILGIPAINATLLLSDAIDRRASGRPRRGRHHGRSDRRREWRGGRVGGRRLDLGRPVEIAVVGAGVQGESHVAMLADGAARMQPQAP